MANLLLYVISFSLVKRGDNCTASQLCGITLPVRPSCLPAGGNLCQFNSLRPRLNRRPFGDDILNENEWILPRISLKFVPKVRINNIPALVQIMAWRRPGDKPLSEPMMVSLLTHICVTRPQWVNRNHLTIYKTPFVTLWLSFMVAFVLIAISCKLSLYANYHLKPKSQSC